MLGDLHDFGDLKVVEGVLNDGFLILAKNETAIVGNKVICEVGVVWLVAFDAGETTAAGDDEFVRLVAPLFDGGNIVVQLGKIGIRMTPKCAVKVTEDNHAYILAREKQGAFLI